MSTYHVLEDATRAQRSLTHSCQCRTSREREEESDELRMALRALRIISSGVKREKLDRVPIIESSVKLHVADHFLSTVDTMLS
jgi:hypothetical protein